MTVLETYPPLAIVIVTHIRTEEAVRTVRATCQNLDYPGPKKWYVGDNNSNYEHVEAICQAIKEEGYGLIGVHSEMIAPNPYHCGASWNIALRSAHEYSDFVLWLEDDWTLDKKLDMAPYVELLTDRTDVGLVRLGGLAIESDVRIVGHKGRHYLKYLKNTQYAYSGNPSLRHKRFLEWYGDFPADRNPGLIELWMDDQYRAYVDGGPDIWRPVDLGGWGVYGHVGKSKSYKEDE